MGNSVVIGLLWTIFFNFFFFFFCEAILDQAPLDVLGTPEVASIRLPSRTSRTSCASVSAGRSRSSGSTACSCVPPAAEARMASCLVQRAVVGDDLAVAHLVDVPVHQAGDHGLTEAEAGLDGGDPPVGRRRGRP